MSRTFVLIWDWKIDASDLPLQPSVLATQTIILILPANLVTRNIKQCPDDHLPLTRGLSTPSLDIILKQLMNLEFEFYENFVTILSH